ncbi:MAG: DEAD/DEAH box helicase family protein [Pseudomonadota bacterium]
MTTLSPTLRPYQSEAIAAVLAARRSGVRRMLVCLPTGAGKTVIFSHLAQLARRQVLVLAHREELLSQARTKLEHALQRNGRRRTRTRRRARCLRRQGARVFDSLTSRTAPGRGHSS